MKSIDFIHEFEVSGYELDSFGHVNNAVYLNYYEQSRWKIMQEMGLLDFLRNADLFLFVVKAQLKFIKELNLLEKAYVVSSFKTEGFFVVFKQEVFNEAKEKVNTGIIKCLFVNRKREAVDIPDELLKYSNHG
ncbi:MAG: acyl-CoA thioesterase [Bacteroidales bacterium]|nr:acyl-CoA thioesterase [Bacteroidales bacterium]